MVGRHWDEQRFEPSLATRTQLFPFCLSSMTTVLLSWFLLLKLRKDDGLSHLVVGVGSSDPEEDKDDGKVHLLEQLQPEQYQRADHWRRYQVACAGSTMCVPSRMEGSVTVCHTPPVTPPVSCPVQRARPEGLPEPFWPTHQWSRGSMELCSSLLVFCSGCPEPSSLYTLPRYTSNPRLPQLLRVMSSQDFP